MSIPGASDPIQEWADAQQRVIELVENLDADAAGRHVPACPAWTVHDLLAHMIGLDADVLAGNEPDDHNDAWTQAQVDARRGASMAELVAEWRAMTGPLQAWMRENNPRPMGDAVIHEQDLRGALGAPGARDTPALAMLRDRFVPRFEDAVTRKELEPLRVDAGGWAMGPEGADVALETSGFDLTRALMSRRSAAQIRSWAVRGDVEPYLDCFAILGPLPDADLTD